MDLHTDELSTTSALAHYTRLRMLEELRTETCTFDDLKDKLNLGGSAVNFHLRTLVDTKLVEEAEVGYQLTNRGKVVLEALIESAKERLEKQGDTSEE